jgi:hypothetical protein
MYIHIYLYKYNNFISIWIYVGIPSTRGVLFKEVVETFAANNGITFIPKVGRVQDGKQVFMFGKSLCYLDQDVVFVSTATKTVTAEWRPIGLEELLKISL